MKSKRKQRRERNARAWSRWERGILPPEIRKVTKPDDCWINNLYQVLVYRLSRVDNWPKMFWLSIKRRDKRPIREWRHLQRIKNEIIGEENEAVELFPAESRLVDCANQFHIYVLADPKKRFPFGFEGRCVVDGGESRTGSKQAPLEERPKDAISADEADKMVEKALEKVLAEKGDET